MSIGDLCERHYLGDTLTFSELRSVGAVLPFPDRNIWSVHLVKLASTNEMSNGHARRLLQSGAVKLNDKIIRDTELTITTGDVVKVGKEAPKTILIEGIK